MEGTTINVRGLDKAEILAELYNNSKPLGLGFLHFEPKDMTIEEARKVLSFCPYVDYLKGRVIKVNFEEDDIHFGLYDRDIGEGAAQKIINSLKIKHGIK